MTDLADTIDRGEGHPGLWIRSIALCLGMAGGLHLVGIVGVYHAVLDPLPRSSMLVVAVALLAAGLGPWLPQRVIARRLRSIRRDGDVVGVGLRWEFLSHTATPAQQGLLWVVLAVGCLSTGTIALILLWAARPIELACLWLTQRFFLSPAELLAADVSAVVAGVFVPWVIIGLIAACLYALAASHDPPSRAGGGVAGFILVGAASGLAVSSWTILQSSPGRTALIGMLPMFVAAALAVVRAGKHQSLQAGEAYPEAQVPEHAPEAGYALLATLTAWGGLVGTALAVWPRVVTTGLSVAPVAESLLPAWFLLFVGVGVLVAGLPASRSDHPAGACGLVMVLAGVAMGLAIAGCAIAGLVAQGAPHADGRWTTVIVLSALAVGGGGAGAAFPYLKRALIAQSGSPAVASAQVLTAVLTGGALAGLAATCWIVPVAGTLVALAAAGLVALAAGGLLVIFDVGGPTRHRVRRLLTVFAALLGLMVGLPKVSRVWLGWGHDVVAVQEGAWLTASLVKHGEDLELAFDLQAERPRTGRSRSRAMQRALHAVRQLRGRINRCWLISPGDLLPSEFVGTRGGDVETTGFDPIGPKLFGASRRSSNPSAVADRSAEPALRRLRSTRTQHDLIVIASMPGGHPANAVIWSVEGVQRAMRRVAPRGVLAGLLRPAEHAQTELAVIAATFAAAVRGDTRAGLVGEGTDQVLVLLAAGAPPPEWDWSAAAQAGMRRVGPIAGFVRVVPGVLPNSLRALSLRPSGRMAEGGLQLTDYVSKTRNWRELKPSARPAPVWPPTHVSR